MFWASRKRLVIFLIALIMLVMEKPVKTWGAVNSDAGTHVFVNQAGYLPEALKRVVADKPAKRFMVIEAATGKAVFTGKLIPVKDPTSQKKIWTGDFTEFSKPGSYQIQIQNVGFSYPFSIEPTIYSHLLNLAARSFYLQRCGIDLNDRETGLAHPKCHQNDGVIARKDPYYDAGQQINCTGGWHDAGDYGKYTPTTAVAAAYLMVAYELWPEKFNDGQLRIPESGNGIPDILDEARVGLEWLLSMQRPDGAVYHKLAGSRWPGFISPDDEYQTRYIYGISTAGTGKFAAVMAIAARVWETIDPKFAARAYQAALKAWRFLQEHDEFIWDHDSFDDDGSGAYGQTTDLPDRLWAALELSTLNRTEQPIADLVKQVESHPITTISWVDAFALGCFNYARSANCLPQIKAIVVKKLIDSAEKNLAAAKASGYRYTLDYSEFAWASNKEGLSRGIAMLLAAEFDPKPEYRENALAQLDFVLGLNPLSKCFVAGIGSDPPLNMHHRLVIASGKIIPGLLAGGPNNKSESEVEPFGKGPYSYVDGSRSYSSNETAIDYNAALFFAAAAFATAVNQTSNQQ